MGCFVTVAKAAQIVGVSAKQIQTEIDRGELSAVRGMIHIEDLREVHPDADLHEVDMVSWVTAIKDNPAQLRADDKPINEFSKQELLEHLGRANVELAYYRDRHSKFESLLKEICFSLQDLKKKSEEPNKLQSIIALIERKRSH